VESYQFYSENDCGFIFFDQVGPVAFYHHLHILIVRPHNMTLLREDHCTL